MFLPETVTPPWRPQADVLKTRDGWTLKFDLAGVRLEDVTVSVRGRRISISGARRDAVAEESDSFYIMEISYNRFERTIEMPANLDSFHVSLEARDGMLLVRMTKGDRNV